MKRTRLLTAACCALMAASGLHAQTLNVNQGEITWAHSAEQTGDMTYNAGTTLTIQGKTYTLADVDNITIDDSSVADNTVAVVWSGSAASVVVAGNVAQYLTVTASGADVSIIASEDLEDEITYTLSGSSTDGSFYFDGEYKSTVVLNGLSLTNADGAPITIDNGKRIKVQLTGTNSLADCASGSQKACFFINGHTEFSGSGTLTIAGNTKHGFFSDEYCIVDIDGQIAVTGAVNDGFHINEYFQMKSGTVDITAQGDGVDVGKKEKGDDYDGWAFLDGGTLTATTTGDGCKGFKADSTIVITAGTYTLTTSGASYYDSDEADISSPWAMKTNGKFSMTGGTLNLVSTGTGAKGLNVAEDIAISGGTVSIATTGSRYKYNSELDSKPNGMKSDEGIVISGGTVVVAASSNKGTAFKSDGLIKFNGGNILGFGGKQSSIATTSAQSFSYDSAASIAAGSTVTYGGTSFSVPSVYSNSSAYVVYSTPNM